MNSLNHHYYLKKQDTIPFYVTCQSVGTGLLTKSTDSYLLVGIWDYQESLPRK